MRPRAGMDAAGTVPETGCAGDGLDAPRGRSLAAIVSVPGCLPANCHGAGSIAGIERQRSTQIHPLFARGKRQHRKALPEKRRRTMASDLQRSPARPVQQNHDDSTAFGDLISPKSPSAVSSRIMQANCNTVHLTILMALGILILGSGLTCRGRSGKLLILRLTPRGLRRFRLDTTRSWRISSRTALWNFFFCRGGNSAVEVQLAPDHAHGMKEGKPVGILVRFERGLVHQTADGEVGHHEAIELLAHQIGSFAAQHDLGAAQMGLELVERSLSGKGLAR